MKEALDTVTKVRLAHQAMEAACERIDQLKAENKALKEDLAKAEQEPLPNLYVKDINGNFYPYKEKGHTENCAAFGDDCSDNHLPTSRVGVGENDYTALAEQPAPVQQEPVAWLDEYGNTFPLAAKQYSVVGKHWKPLYTTPPQRKPLTDEQILHFVDTHVGAPSMAYPLDNSDWMNFARAIEAAHGIKE